MIIFIIPTQSRRGRIEGETFPLSFPGSQTGACQLTGESVR